MGTGDAYMMAAIGATLGPAAAVLVFMVAPFMGLPYGIWQVFRGRRGRSAASAGGQGGGSAAEESPDDLPPVKIHVGAFLTTALGAVMLILAAVVARPEWNTRARIFLVMGILACGLGFYLLGREEDRDREAEEAAAREAEKKASRDGKSGRGGTGGKPAAPGPDEAAEDSHEVPYGPFLGAAAGLVMLIQDYCLAQFGPGIHGIWNAIVGG
jgi:hypothetical protein